MAKNEMQWSSTTPGLLIILLDQSGSMLEQYEGSDTRTVFASRAVNKVIDNIIQKNFDGDAPKNRCFISVIGYNHNVKELCSGWLKDLAANPLRYESLKKKMPDGTGGIIEVDVQQPVWVEPIKSDGATNMLGAFKLAKDLVEKWISDNPKNPAPVIINISDGVPYYDMKAPEECMRETTSLVEEIINMSNADGNVLIFNAQIDNKGNGNVTFPSDRNKLSQEEARFLYDITSIVPDSYKAAAAKNELPVENGSRGCIFNADGVQLIQLIDFGSSKGQGDVK
ncbi:MAG: VWA domain-containing protein [Bacteroidales bacterium]|nr:VWA domain-containing protein [Bacteroidales bacterium]